MARTMRALVAQTNKLRFFRLIESLRLPTSRINQK